jgi:hypothetical protein
MSDNPQLDGPDLADPDAPISDIRCDLCGDIETTARPISTWHFSLQGGHWHIRACPSCAHATFGNFLNTGAGIQAGSFRSWQEQLSRYITTHGRRVTLHL